MYLGLDLGTSGVKALLMDGDQKVIGSGHGALDVSRPHSGWSEQDPADWIRATEEAVGELKAQPGPDLMVMGSGELTQTLMQHNLIDRYVLMLHPLVLGSGRRLFTDGGALAALRLTNNQSTDSGVVVATYQPA